MTDGTNTQTVALRLTEAQIDVIEHITAKEGFTDRADMMREAIEMYAERLGYTWPAYELTKNEDRARLKIRGRKSK